MANKQQRGNREKRKPKKEKPKPPPQASSFSQGSFAPKTRKRGASASTCILALVTPQHRLDASTTKRTEKGLEM